MEDFLYFHRVFEKDAIREWGAFTSEIFMAAAFDIWKVCLGEQAGERSSRHDDAAAASNSAELGRTSHNAPRSVEKYTRTFYLLFPPFYSPDSPLKSYCAVQ